jgi:hypothetical protein
LVSERPDFKIIPRAAFSADHIKTAMSHKRIRTVSLTFGRGKNFRQILSNEKFSMSFTPKSLPGTPNLAFRDPKPNTKSVNSEQYLNPVTYLPGHKRNGIDGWSSPRAEEKLD